MAFGGDEMNKRKPSFTFAFAFALGLTLTLVWLMGSARPTLAEPDARYVAPGGSDDGNDCVNGGAPCATVQHAVDVANDGDEVLVAGGTYTGAFGIQKPGDYNSFNAIITQVVYISRTITVRGGYSGDFGDWNPALYTTTLGAEDKGRGILITGQAITVTLESLRITGGDATGLGGSPFYVDAGGGIYVAKATATLSACQVTANRADGGGGIYVLNSANARLTGNIFYDNTATSWGGGIFLEYDGAVMLDDNTILSNTAAYRGGGACLFFSDGVTLSHNAVLSNTASEPSGTAIGGGVYLNGCHDATLSGNTLLGNAADEAGGGVYLTESRHATLSGNTILDNVAQEKGGGVYASESHSATLGGNVILNNIAHSDGGGVYLLSSANARLDNNVVGDNRAGFFGSGIYIGGSDACLRHTTLARNAKFPTGDGNGLYVTNEGLVLGYATLTNTLLISHGVGINVAISNAATLDGVLWYDNVTNTGGQGAITVTHAVTGAPAFAGDGYHLGFASAAIDAGVEAGVATDVDGTPRPLGAGPDLGADEIGLRLASSLSGSALPGAQVIYTHTLSNYAHVAQTFDLVVVSSEECSVTLSPTSTESLAAWTGSTPITVTVRVSGDAVSGTLDTTTITATGSLGGRASVADVTTVSFDHAAPRLLPDRAGTALPDDLVVYTHTLTNHANFTQTFGLAAFSETGYTFTLTPTSTGSLSPFGGWTVISVAVRAPGDALSGTVGSAVVTATGSLYGRDAVTDVTTVLLNQAAPDLLPGQEARVQPGEWAVYTHTLTNRANFTQGFGLAARSSAGYTFTVVPTTTGDLAAWEGSALVRVSVQSPDGAISGTVDTTVVTATGSLGGRDTVSDVTTVRLNDAAPVLRPQRAGSALPGDRVIYTHTLTNQANFTQTFSLFTASSQGWNVEIYMALPPGATPFMPYPLAPGGSVVITSVVWVPADAISGTVDTTVVTATGNLTGYAVVSNTTRALFNHAAPTLSPDHAEQSVPPGGRAVYTHTLTNHANAAQTFGLAALSSGGYSVTLTPRTTGSLAAWGGSALITVTLQLPATAAGKVDTTVLTATALGYSSLWARATDVTTVVGWRTYLPLVLRQSP
jgi:parallel beta-helix repeat protein